MSFSSPLYTDVVILAFRRVPVLESFAFYLTVLQYGARRHLFTLSFFRKTRKGDFNIRLSILNYYTSPIDPLTTTLF